MQPDPAAVQRYGPAYRFPQAGWTVLHIEGEPYERGEQHGRAEVQREREDSDRIRRERRASRQRREPPEQSLAPRIHAAMLNQ